MKDKISDHETVLHASKLNKRIFTVPILKLFIQGCESTYPWMYFLLIHHYSYSSGLAVFYGLRLQYQYIRPVYIPHQSLQKVEMLMRIHNDRWIVRDKLAIYL